MCAQHVILIWSACSRFQIHPAPPPQSFHHSPTWMMFQWFIFWDRLSKDGGISAIFGWSFSLCPGSRPRNVPKNRYRLGFFLFSSLFCFQLQRSVFLLRWGGPPTAWRVLNGSADCCLWFLKKHTILPPPPFSWWSVSKQNCRVYRQMEVFILKNLNIKQKNLKTAHNDLL